MDSHEMNENEPKLSELIAERDGKVESTFDEYLKFRHEVKPNIYQIVDAAYKRYIDRLIFGP